MICCELFIFLLASMDPFRLVMTSVSVIQTRTNSLRATTSLVSLVPALAPREARRGNEYCRPCILSSSINQTLVYFLDPFYNSSCFISSTPFRQARKALEHANL